MLPRRALVSYAVWPLVVGLSLCGQNAFGEPAARVTLPNHVVSLPRTVKKVAPPPAAATALLTMTIVLARTDEAGFAKFVDEVGNPKSPLFRQFLSPALLADRYGPSPKAYAAVRAFGIKNGLRVVQESANRLTLTLRGTRALAEKAFGVTFDDYQVGERTFFANRTNPRVPATLAPMIRVIDGLTNLARPHVAGNGLGFTCDNTPQQFAVSYDFGAIPADGTGQTVGLVEWNNFNPGDVTDWLGCAGLPASLASHVSAVAVAGGTGPSAPSEIEVLLDIGTVLGMAPGANVVVFDAPYPGWPQGSLSATNWVQMLNAMINAKVNIISSSWGSCESEHSGAELDGIDAVLAAAAASGISVFQASGDTGAVCLSGKVEANVLGGMPHATTVGGTVLGSIGGAYPGEAYWGLTTPGCFGGAGGFGVSGHFQAPPWQTGSLPPGVSGRSFPDVSADACTGIQLCEADAGGCPIPTIINSQGIFNNPVSGTSMAAPEWAAGTALLNQVCGGASGLVASWVNTVSLTGFPALHSPGSMTPPLNDFSHVGFGSFDLGNLATALCPATARLTRVASYQFSQTPIAVAGSLTPSQVVKLTITALDSAGVPVPLAPAWLALAPAIGVAGGMNPLSPGPGPGYFVAAPKLFLTDANGTVNLTYATPAISGSQGGTDVIRVENAEVSATVGAEDSYTYQALASLVFQPSPLGFWPAGSAPVPNTAIPVTLLALDASSQPIPAVQVQVSFIPSPTLTGSGLVATNLQGVLIPVRNPITLQTNASGQIPLTYVTPHGVSGQDSVTAVVAAPAGAFGTETFATVATPDTFTIFQAGIPVLTTTTDACGGATVQAAVFTATGQPDMTAQTILFQSNGYPFAGASASQPTQIQSPAVGGIAVAQLLPSAAVSQPKPTVSASLFPNSQGTTTIPVTVVPGAARVCALQSQVSGRINLSQFFAGFVFPPQLLRCLPGPCGPLSLTGVWQQQTGDPAVDDFALTVRAADAAALRKVSQSIAVRLLSSTERNALLLRYPVVAVSNSTSGSTEVTFVGGAMEVSSPTHSTSLFSETGSTATLSIPYQPGKMHSNIRIVALGRARGRWTATGITMIGDAAGVATARISAPATYAVVSESVGQRQ